MYADPKNMFRFEVIHVYHMVGKHCKVYVLEIIHVMLTYENLTQESPCTKSVCQVEKCEFLFSDNIMSHFQTETLISYISYVLHMSNIFFTHVKCFTCVRYDSWMVDMFCICQIYVYMFSICEMYVFKHMIR